MCVCVCVCVQNEQIEIVHDVCYRVINKSYYLIDTAFITI